jgi:hypothetical protein
VAETADGGNIQLMAGSLLQLIDSQVAATSRSGRGREGNITLSSPFSVLDRSLIRTQAFGGPGGNIRIGAEVFLAAESVVSASSNLELMTTTTPLVTPLSQTFMSVAALLPARCAARFKGGRSSSLVLGGPDGLPTDPGGVLPSPLILGERLMADPAVTGEHGRHSSSARFALLAGQEKALPRLRGADPPGEPAAVLARGCAK